MLRGAPPALTRSQGCLFRFDGPMVGSGLVLLLYAYGRVSAGRVYQRLVRALCEV